MKKQKMLKLTAYLSDPSAENSFSAPVTHSGEISVVFRGKNVSIHGFDGSAWTTIYTWNSLDPQYQMNNAYQSYYLKSLTGSEETLNVSFFSTEKYQGSTPQIAGIDRATKLHDIDEVPIYTSSDENKMLTIMSNGSLAWLLANESFVIGAADPGSSYLESSATLSGDANLSNGSLVLDGTGDYAVIDDGFRFTDKMTTSVWFKTSATGDRRIYSSHVRSMGGADYRNGFFARLNSGQLKFRHPAGGTGELTGPSGLNDGAWHHLALSWEAGVGYVLYVDGAQRKTGGSGASDGYAAGWGLYIGANPWNNNNPYALFDGEIKKFEVLNEVLTAQQVIDLYNVEAPTPSPASSVSTGIEALGTNTLSGDAQVTAEGLLIANDGYADTQSNYHNGATEQTISAWFKASELGTVNGNGDLTWRDNGHMIALTRNWAAGGNRANGFVISVASNAVRFGGPHGTNNVVKADYDFSVDTWYKIDLVWTANSMKLYVNGVEVGSTASSGTIAGGSINMRIGRNINQWMSFKGNILGVEVENVARSSAEILTSYQSEV